MGGGGGGVFCGWLVGWCVADQMSFPVRSKRWVRDKYPSPKEYSKQRWSKLPLEAAPEPLPLHTGPSVVYRTQTLAAVLESFPVELVRLIDSYVVANNRLLFFEGLKRLKVYDM